MIRRCMCRTTDPCTCVLNKIYLGDGAYAEFHGYEIHVTAENGIEATNRVVMEPPALRTLIEFAKTKGWSL